MKLESINHQGSLAMTSGNASAPFLKWLGGKRWLIPIIKEYVTKTRPMRYMEPFLGGGAFFFNFGFIPAYLSDLNEELINSYIQVKNNPIELTRRLQLLKTDRASYYKIRDSNPQDHLSRAIRFLYLNRTGFRGIYRVNGKGKYNVPYGHYLRGLETYWEDELLIKASTALQGATLICSDFEQVLSNAGSGDLVYCDPTYTVMHNNNGFRQYNEKSFSWADQKRLARCCRAAVQKGASIIVSNAYHTEIKALYNGFEARVVERKSVLCPFPKKRTAIQEYLFYKLY